MRAQVLNRLSVWLAPSQTRPGSLMNLGLWRAKVKVSSWGAKEHNFLCTFSTLSRANTNTSSGWELATGGCVMIALKRVNPISVRLIMSEH